MMRVSLNHAEIQAAVVAALVARGVTVDGQDIAVSFSMGRKNTGLSATVDLIDPSVQQLPPTQDAPEVEPETPVAPVGNEEASSNATDYSTTATAPSADPVQQEEVASAAPAAPVTSSSDGPTTSLFA